VYYECPNTGIGNNSFYSNCMAPIAADGNVNCFVLALSNNTTGLSFTNNRMITNRCHFYFGDFYGYNFGMGFGVTLTNNYIELPSVGGGLNYANFFNGCELTFGTLTLTSASVSGSTVTVNYASTTSQPGWGSPITISGVTGGSGINGTFAAAQITAITNTQVQYNSGGASGSGTGGTLAAQIVVNATFNGNVWVHGTWNGPTTIGSYTGSVVGAIGGASGTTPVSYSNLGPNMTYTFNAEPAGIL
jgi:hypothetical protein